MSWESEITKQTMGGSKIAAAILQAQKEMGNAVKGSNNPFFKSKYADLNAIREAVIPALHAAGIAVLQPTVHIDGRNFVRTVLLHESGEEYASLTEIICAKPNDPQAQGSAISYARRYGLQSLPCVGAEDDDGESAMHRAAPPKITTLASTSPKAALISLAQVAVAKKVSTKAELLSMFEAKSESITDAVEALDSKKIKEYTKILEGKIK